VTGLKDLAVEEARARMLAAAAPGPPESIALDRFASGRVLAEPVRAGRDQPPFDASAMDGYAVRVGDNAQTFSLVGESAAGRPFTGEVGPGEAVRVFTGAEVPPGCAVIMQEQALAEAGRVGFTSPIPSERAYVRPSAGDFAAGATLLAAGVRLDAWSIALAAAAGQGEVKVYPQPRVLILATGEEIVAGGTADISSSQIYDANGPALATLVAGWGGRPVGAEIVGDDEAALVAAVGRTEAELTVVIGGASVGAYDLAKPALSRLGLELAVETIRLRPGKPTWFGRLADGRSVLGLPGNPASGLVTAELFLRPLLAALQGADPSLPLERARLTRPLPQAGMREHWMRARLESAADGSLTVTPFADQDSSLVSVFAAANALLRRPAEAPPAQPGEVVDVLRLQRL
jgi:molybdopterin molybdotransferase